MGLNPIGNSNWAQETTDLVERYVGKVRDTATHKAAIGVRAVAYGLVIVVAGIVAAVVATLILTRGVQRFVFTSIFGADHATSVWLSYLSVGALFTVAGALAFRWARSGPKSA